MKHAAGFQTNGDTELSDRELRCFSFTLLYRINYCNNDLQLEEGAPSQLQAKQKKAGGIVSCEKVKKLQNLHARTAQVRK
jgi:hypothetical protein